MAWGSNVFPLLIITPTGGFTGLFLYSPAPGPGNLIGSWTAANGIDPFGNPFPAGINVTQGVLSGVAINALQEILNPGPLLLYGNQNTTAFVFTSTGTFTPTSNGTVSVGFIGQGAGGTGTFSGGGGEYAQDTDTVTNGTPYTITLDATSTRATFNTKTVTAHSATGRLGATGSTNAIHHNGGNGVSTGFGAGGGGAGAGSAGGNASGPVAGLGGSGAGLFPAGGAGGTAAGAGNAPGGGGAFNAGGSAGGAGVAVIYFTGTGGSVKLLDSIAQASGTDPSTGSNYNGGVWNYNPTFGTAAGLTNGGLSLHTGVGVAFLEAQGGYPVATSNTDSNLYNLTTFHLVASPAQNITAIAFPNAVTGATVPVGINHYRFRCVINCTTASAAGTPQFEFTFPSATGVVMQTYTPLITAGSAQSNQASFSAATSVALGVGPTLNGHGFICVWEGDFTTTAAGNLALNAITSVATDPYTVATVWLDLYPVN